jgi:transcriptional regulator with XRE-family HTH domain
MARAGPRSLGEFIRNQRELHELSMRQLATRVGISNPYLSQIERGLRDPSERVIDAIARSLEVSADTLYEQAGLARQGEEDKPEVLKALGEDPDLTARQRQALTEIYWAFVVANEAGRPRRRNRGAGSTTPARK